MGQLEDLTVFIRIVEAGGISRAAEQLNLVKSAVSRRLVDLETRVGTQLINRTTRTSSLTDAGQLYYERAKRIVDDVIELNASVQDTETTLKGSIKLAAPLSFGLLHLTPAIDAFVKQHPALNIKIDFSDRQVDLIEEGLDLAFRIANLTDSNLIARKIAPIRTVLCASPGYLKVHGVPKTHEDLERHHLLSYSLSKSNSWKLTDKTGKQHHIKLNAKIVANNGDFLNGMAIAGHGIILLPTFISWKAIANKQLIPVLADYRTPELNAYAVYPQTRYLSQRTRLLIDFLVERFGSKPYWDQNFK